MRFIVFILCMTIGMVSIIYSKWLVDSLGSSDWIESKLGSGGMYSFWKLLGVFFIIFAFYYAFNG